MHQTPTQLPLFAESKKRTLPRSRRRRPMEIVYHRITVGSGETFVFRHTLVKRGKCWIAQTFAPLVGRYADRDCAIAEVERLNREVAPLETRKLNQEEAHQP